MIQWNDSFSIGDPHVDAQHRMFLSLIERFSEARIQGASNDKLHRILQELLRYAAFHFYSEENLMMDCHSPDLEVHRGLHAQLMETLKDNVYGFELGECSSIQVEDFLVDWFVMHTTQEDKKISA